MYWTPPDVLNHTLYRVVLCLYQVHKWKYSSFFSCLIVNLCISNVIQSIVLQFVENLKKHTVIRLIKDASLIEDEPQLQPSFLCNKLWVMMMGKLPNWRRASSLEHFMRNFWSLSSQCLCIKVEFRNNYSATNSWECLSHILECQIAILAGKKSPFSMYFLSLAKRWNWSK